MAFFTLQTPPALPDQLCHADTALLVVCFCAAWCDTCTEFQPAFQDLADRWPDAIFIWVDIEDHPELLGDRDIENFPTIMLQTRNDTLFFGELPPHISHVERLLRVYDRDPTALRAVEGLPSLFEALGP